MAIYYVLSPNMNLPIPIIGTDPGPDWATNLNSCQTLIDGHDHTTGKGVPITSKAINISSDLAFNGNNATLLRSTRYSPQSSALALATDIGCLYVNGVDLYYNDVSGNQIRLTQSGGIVGTSGSITGLVAPASATYSSGAQKFIWQSDVNTAATMDFRSAILRNSTASSFGLTLQPPTLTVDYSITLPTLPGSLSFLTMDNLGVITASPTVTGGITGAMIAANTISASNIVNNTLTTTQISATAGILGSQLANNTVTKTNQVTRVATNSLAAVGNIALSSSVGSGFNFVGTTFVAPTSSQTATISIASPAVITVAVVNGQIGAPVRFSTTGALPTGIVAGTTYYILNPGSTTFNISATPGGAAINTTGTQSGTHTVTFITFSASLNTTGGVVAISLVPDGTANAAGLGGGNGSTTASNIPLQFQVVRNGTTVVGVFDFPDFWLTVSSTATAGTENFFIPNISCVDVSGVSPATYHLEGKGGSGGNQYAKIKYVKLLAYEL